MDELAPTGKKARLFVALDLPGDVRNELARWRDETLGGIDSLRLVPPENLHLTLAFLGHLPEERIAGVAATLEGLDCIAPRLTLGPEIVGVPRGRRPRLLAITLAGDGIAKLQDAVVGRLERGGFYEREERPFWPHLTLARVRPERRGSKRPARLPELRGALPGGLAEQPFDAVRLALYRSRLAPKGSSYEVQAHFDLPPAAAT